MRPCFAICPQFVSRMPAAERRTNGTNDLDLSHWQQYADLLTDSLWLLDARDSSGAHQADYHGNFIPQIPHQLLRRFTKAGDIVLDPFMGSGTTAIEANRLRRRYIGIELSPAAAELARQRIASDRLHLFDGEWDDPGFSSDESRIFIGDSGAAETAETIGGQLAAMGSRQVQFVLLHPPYHNIIRFSDSPDDLSNCRDAEHFMQRFLEVYANAGPFLEPGRHLAVVIGDIYANSEWVPLQNMLTARLLDTGELRLKSIIVKNMVNNRAKRNQEKLWRYRALANGFYIFKHEYIVLFQKLKKGRRGRNAAAVD